MCIGFPPSTAAPAVPVAAPPPPPQKDPNPPVIANNDRSNTDALKKGTSIFRNDLSIPTGGGSGGSVGTGLNVPR